MWVSEKNKTILDKMLFYHVGFKGENKKQNINFTNNEINKTKQPKIKF